MNKAKRGEHRWEINWHVLIGWILFVGFIVFVVLGFSVVGWLTVMAFQTSNMRANAPCEDFAAWTEPPARCWEYFGGRDR